jgi:hypothetical protein
MGDFQYCCKKRGVVSRERHATVHGKKLEDELKERYHVGMDKTLARMAVQLKLMGYEVNMESMSYNQESAPRIACFHEEYCNLGILRDIEPHHYMLYAPLRTSSEPVEELDAVIHEINRSLLVSEVRFDVRGGKVNVFCEAYFNGEYTGKRFENFFVLFINDQRKMETEIRKILTLETKKRGTGTIEF